MNINTFFKCWAAVLIGAIIYIVLFAGDVQAAETVTPPVVTLQQSLITIIQQVQSGVSAGVNFLSTEIPDVIRQLIVWKLVESVILAVASLLASLGCAYGIYKSWKNDDMDGDAVVPITIFGGMFLLAGLILTVCKSLVALQLWLAPKVWLIEYAAKLVN